MLFILCGVDAFRVNERMLLIDAVKDLANHVCSKADKTAVNDAVIYFTSHVSEVHDKQAATDRAASNTHSADQTLTTSSGNDSTRANDDPSKTGFQDEEVNAHEVAAADEDRSVNGAVHAECQWKLLIKVDDRHKSMSHRYCYLHTCHNVILQY